MTTSQEQEDVALLNALHTMFSSGIHADLLLVTSSPSSIGVEKIFGVHKFVLQAFNPAFLAHCLKPKTATSSSTQEDINTTTTVEQSDGSNNSLFMQDKSSNDQSIQRVYVDDISAESLSLFLENLYTAGIRRPNDHTAKEWQAYEAFRDKFPANSTSGNPPALVGRWAEYRHHPHLLMAITSPTTPTPTSTNNPPSVPPSNVVTASSALSLHPLHAVTTSSTSLSSGQWIEWKKRQLQAQVNDPTYSDICFLLDDSQCVHSHKAILSTRCEVFRAMFDIEVGLTESRQKTVPLPFTSKESLDALFGYIYGANLEIEPEDCVDIMLLCDRYSMTSLHSRAQSHVMDGVSIENACDIFMVAARVNGAHDLYDHCLKFITHRDHLPAVTASEGFASLETDLIVKIAEEITRTFDRTYRPTQFVAEILHTIHLLGNDSLAVNQLSVLISEMCAKLGTSRQEDELYTSRVRSDLVKDKFQHYRLKFEEVTHSAVVPTVDTKKRDKRFLHYFPDPSDTITKHLASLLNVDVRLVMKCLVFWWYFPDNKRDKHYIVVLTCGNERIDENMLQAHVPKDAIVLLAGSERVYRNLGASALWKLIPPLGFRMKIPTLIEERVMELPHIYVPSGRSEVTWKMNPNDLVVMFSNLEVPCSIAPLRSVQPPNFITKVPDTHTADTSNNDNKPTQL